MQHDFKIITITLFENLRDLKVSLFVTVYVRFAPIANKDIKFVYRSLQNVTKVQILIV